METALRFRPQRGFLLLPVLVLTVLLGGLSLAFLQEGLADRQSVEHHETSLLALEIAEAGVVRAEMEIRALVDPDADGIGTVSAAYAGGGYEVQAAQDANHPDRWIVRSRGERRLSTRLIEVGLRRRERGFFIEGLFARDGIVGNGSVATDSYDSRKGTWDTQAVNSDAGGRYAKGRGDVGSNKGIRFTGTSLHVRGNAIPGPLSLVDAEGQPVIWGDTMPREHEIPIPPPPLEDFEAALAENDNDQLLPTAGASGNIKVKSDVGYDARTMALTPVGQQQPVLSGGTYFFTDLVLSGGASLLVEGPCTIYVTGELDLTGGTLVNQTGAATNCLIYSHPYPLPEGFLPSAKPVAISGGPSVAAAVYAPYRDVVVSGGPDFFGSIVGQQIKVNGDVQFHYDEALLEVTGDNVVYLERLFWRDLTTPER